MNHKLKKDKGAMDGIIFMMVSLFICIVLFVGFIPCFQMLSIKQNINQVARPYLLVMEAEGYLSPENKILLEKDIKAINGVTRVDFNPQTTTSAVGYGQWLYLDFDIQYTIDMPVVNSIFSVLEYSTTFETNYSKKSTSKS